MEEPDRQLGTTSCMILGLVGKRRMSGYDLAGLAARSIDHFWPISKSQIYTELGRLERHRYITGTHVEQDRKPDKRCFELTASGEQALDAWLRSPGYPSERNRNGLLAKFFFAERMTDAERIELLRDYRDRTDRYRLELQALVDRLEGRDHAVYGRATARYGLLAAEASVAWVDEMLDELG
jgi:DNA-binding PadR family transcriptional regulator